MSIDFPNSPTLNQTFSTAGKNWQWDGTAWQLLAVAPDAILKSVLDAKGDLVVGTAADTVGRLGVGTDGQVLTASSSATGGLIWAEATAAGGATGGGSDEVFYENDQTVTTSYTITSGKNAMTAGPVEIASGVDVTIPSGSVWVIL